MSRRACFTHPFGRHFATTLAAQTGILLLGGVTGVAAARLLGPQGRGELAALTLWPGTLVFLASMGINQAIVFFTGRKEHAVAQVWTASTVVGLGQSACVVLTGLVVIPFALGHYPAGVRHLSLMLVATSPIVILGGYPGNLLQGRLSLGSFNLVRLVAPLVYALGLAILLWLGRPSLKAVVWSQILGAGVAMALGYGLLLKQSRLRFAWHGGACRSLLNFGWKTQLANVSSYVNQSFDQLVLTLFVAPRELGLYVVAVAVSSAVGFLPQAAGIVTLAAGSNLDPRQARRVIAESFRVSLLWLLLACSLLFFAAPGLISLVFGPSFAAAALACRILLPGMIAVGLCQVLYDGARALGQPLLPSYAEIAGMAVTCASLFVLVPRYGFVGAAVASTLAYLGSLTTMLVLSHLRMPLSVCELVGIYPATAWREAGEA